MEVGGYRRAMVCLLAARMHVPTGEVASEDRVASRKRWHVRMGDVRRWFWSVTPWWDGDARGVCRCHSTGMPSRVFHLSEMREVDMSWICNHHPSIRYMSSMHEVFMLIHDP